MDRAQLLVVRVLIGTYCERANMTDRSSACTPPLSTHIASMKTSIAQQEEYHQGARVPRGAPVALRRYITDCDLHMRVCRGLHAALLPCGVLRFAPV